MPEQIPECAGYWLAGVTCDGGINAAGENEASCSWRRRCRLIQEHMMKINTDPQTYRARYGTESLNRLLTRLEKEIQTPPSKQKKTVTKKKVKKERKKRITKVTKKKMRERRHRPLKAMFVEFTAAIAKVCFEGGKKVVWCARRTAAVKPGYMYAVDRTDKSYYNVYMRRAKGRAYKVAVVKLVPINGGLDVQVRDTEEIENLPEGLRQVFWHDPPLFSVIRTMSTPEHYQWVARHLVKAAKESLKNA